MFIAWLSSISVRSKFEEGRKERKINFGIIFSIE
jgi:hypothetical protein